MRSWLKPMVVVAAFAMVGCGDDGSGPNAQASIVGTWDVQSIDGNSLPWTETETFEGVTCTFTLHAMVVTFTNNKTYSGTEDFSGSCAGQTFPRTTEPFNGTYSIQGNQLTMTDAEHPNDPDTATFTISGSTLTVIIVEDGETTTLVAKKR